MNRMTRNALAAALTAAVALGVTAPVASAAPKAAHARTEHKAVKAHKTHKAAKADRALAGAQRRLSREVARKDAYLGRLARAHKVVRLADDVETAVVLNITGDRTDLTTLKSSFAASSGDDLRALAREVHKVRPEVYNTIVNQLRVATWLQPRAAALPEAGDLAALIETLEGYDATTSRADLRAAQRVLAKVQTAVEEAGSDPSTQTPEAPEAPAPAPGAGTTN